MKLYIYDHCPFCIKARMIFGLKNIPVELNVLANDDDETPTRMIGQKMVPILQKDDSRYLPESMDIVHYVDKLDGKPLLTGKKNPAIDEWLRKVNSYANHLLLPRFAKSAFDEFSSPSARKYFTEKKEAMIGSFADHLAHSAGLTKKISDDLRALDKLIVQPNGVNGELSEDDIQLFPLLRNLTLVAGINWPTRVADYRDNMAKQTQIDPIKPLMFVANFGQAGAAFGVFLRSRNKKTRTLALSTSFSALMGVSEPAMYGINIRFKKPFAAALIGGAAGGCLAMTMGVKAYAYALSGLSGLPALAGEGFGWALASIALAFAVAALVTVVLGFEEAAEVQPATATETDIVAAQSKDLQAGISRVNVAAGEQLYAPAEGKLIPLSEVSDPVFADEVFGKGIAIVPVNGQLVSPLNGRVGSVFATNHAITLESESGAEILIHIGIDTVKLNGKGFTRHVDDEQLVRVGEPLISFDLDALQADNIDPSIIIIVTNTERYNDISLISQTKVEPREAFLKLTAAAV